MAIKTFTTGEVLTASDTNTYLANSGLVFVKQTTIGSTVASVPVTDAFSATYDSYVILINGGVGSATAENVGLQLGSTTTGYRDSAIGVSTAGTVSGSYNNNTQTRFIIVGASDPSGTIARIELWNPFLALNTFFESQMIRAGAHSHFKTFGSLANTTSYTGFTIIPGSGTLTGGNITVYGYRKG
jgi:hypothetical protein